MKISIKLLVAFMMPWLVCRAQNVGIGTTSPEYSLHILNSAGESSVGINATGTATQALLNLSIDNRIGGNSLALIKFRPDAPGSIAGIPKANLSVIAADAGAAALLISTNQASPMFFVTNNIVRLRISPGGEINVNNPSLPDYALINVAGRVDKGVAMFVNDLITTGGQRAATVASINTSAPGSSAIAGSTYEGGGTSPIELVTYGVLGTAGNGGYAVAGYALGSTALRGKSTSGLALHTTGLLRLEGNGAGAGKVLTSDASGNATWQSSAHDHFGESWSGAASTGLNIVNTMVDGAGIRGTGQSAGVAGWSSHVNGIGVIGVNNSSGNYHTIVGNTAIAGVAGNGTGVYAASVTGTSFYAHKGNFGSASGLVALFENQKTGLTNTPVVRISGVSNQPVLELNNGFLKVAGTSKTAFTVTATAGNSAGHILNLNYAGQSATDILIVTHNYNPPGAPLAYHDYNVGVFWTSTNWAIYNENTAIPILNKSFNVLVIKQ